MPGHWSIQKPTVGFDRIKIASSAGTRVLAKDKAIANLKRVMHRVSVWHKQMNPAYRSNVEVVCTAPGAALKHLAGVESVFGRYRIVEVEVTRDLPVVSADAAAQWLDWIVAHLRKKRHSRGHLIVIPPEPGAAPPPGLLPLPTTYFEDASSSLGLKVYARHEKLPRGQFGNLIVRIEWTLRRAAIDRYLAGHTLRDLVAFDINDFVSGQLHLEMIDYPALGRLFSPRRTVDDEQARRKAYLLLRVLAYRTEYQFADWEEALGTWNTPAQVRGYLATLRRAHAGAGHRSKRGQRPRTITAYRANACFVPMR